MNNKGFTLVELLAVMVILLSISVIVVTNVTASLKRNEQQEKTNQEKIAINAAKIYFSMNGGTGVTIEKLINEKYLESNSVDKLTKTYYVVICNNKNEYKIKSGSGTTC